MNKPENNIRIHPPGSGRITDNNKAQMLAISAPAAFRKAQDVLVSAQKYVKKSGFFSSDRSRTQKLQAECYEFVRALRADQFMSEEMASRREQFVFIEFFSLFSDAFPNWQSEYEVLNRFAPLIF